MSQLPETQTTSIATHTTEDIYIRGKSLCRELMGKTSFTEMIFFHIQGRMPTRAEAAMVDACLVALMEHGLTPSALAARLTYSSAPESVQGAVAAGLQGVGGLFAGTVEGCAALLARVVGADTGFEAEARTIAEEHGATGTPVPGFGHPIHTPDDPRAVRLLELADSLGQSGRHVAAVRALSRAVDAARGKHVTINATGAIAAVLGDCGVEHRIMRGFAVISRCVGLVSHIHEEQQAPAMRAIWEAGERAVPYAQHRDGGS